jgi:OOP family OmpA-OmpF porin
MKGMAMSSQKKNLGRKAAVASAMALATMGAAAANAQSLDAHGWYAGVFAGRSDLELKDGSPDSTFSGQGLTTSSSVDKHHTAYSLDIGYQLNPWFAIEGQYVDFGKFDFSSTIVAPAPDTIDGRFKAHGFGLNAVGIVPLPQGFSLYGKAGVFRSSTELEANAGLTPVSGGSRNHTGGDFGVGASYDFTRNFAAKVEWDRYLKLGDSGTTGRGDIDLVMAGLQYRF